MLEKIKGIFDEKNDRWIVIIKWLFIFSCIFLMIYFPFEAKGSLYNSHNWALLCKKLAFTIVSFFSGMLLLNVIRNLQMIREKLCGKNEYENQ